MTNHVSFKQRLRYRFDNFMAKGPAAQIIGLAVITIALMFVFALIIFDFDLAPEWSDGRTFWQSFWGVLRPGTPPWDASRPGYMIVKILMLLSGEVAESVPPRNAPSPETVTLEIAAAMLSSLACSVKPPEMVMLPPVVTVPGVLTSTSGRELDATVVTVPVPRKRTRPLPVMAPLTVIPPLTARGKPGGMSRTALGSRVRD